MVDKILMVIWFLSVVVFVVVMGKEFLWGKTPSKDLHIKILKQDAIVPTRGTDESAGYDLFCLHDNPIMLEYGNVIRIGTGLAMKIPDGMVGVIQPRSSAFHRGILTNGWVDSDYRGEVFVTFQQTSRNINKLEPGKSYAQLILMKYEKLNTKIVKELPDTKRGTGGLGSTGHN